MSRSVARDLLQIFNSCVDSVFPENLVKNAVKYDALTQRLSVFDNTYDLKNKKVYIAGTGKAVQGMARLLNRILRDKVEYGILSIPQGSLSDHLDSKIQYFEGAENNLPDANSLATSVKIKEMAEKLSKDDFFIVLISGGGSALLTLPKPSISLEEKTKLIKNLANTGADIKELNTVRKKLSLLKGGKLAATAQPATVISLILSDIVGDPIELIASGPTVENTDTHLKALEIVKRYLNFENLSEAIKNELLQEDDKKTFPLCNVKNYIIGSNKFSIQAGKIEAGRLAYYPIVLSSSITGNVQNVALKYTAIIQAICTFIEGKSNSEDTKNEIKCLDIQGLNADEIQIPLNKNLCLISGGEITVQVKGSGIGGRNQQLALEISKEMAHRREIFKNFEVFFLSAGTDGIDGPTDAAGAISYPDLLIDAQKDELDVIRFIENNDSYSFYKRFKNGSFHVKTGHTNTNVMDIHLIIIKKRELA